MFRASSAGNYFPGFYFFALLAFQTKSKNRLLIAKHIWLLPKVLYRSILTWFVVAILVLHVLIVLPVHHITIWHHIYI
ncbi:hypothetical protein XELAEV_18008282mg [Xenopus laevis]|uniref:Uncharacterized protein n=1 Tax=Xenopus laevis TaxID=8355 RepID=A0A974E2Z3_XENLA|nr:hypothetical protein XELAEV_18008282mg [Xenopus laevis]